MSDNEEFERTRDFVRSTRRPVRRTAGPRSGSVITSSPRPGPGRDTGRGDGNEPPAARGRPAPRRECLSHVAGYPVLALVAGYGCCSRRGDAAALEELVTPVSASRGRVPVE